MHVVNDRPRKLFVNSKLDYYKILYLCDYFHSWGGSATFVIVNLFWLIPP